MKPKPSNINCERWTDRFIYDLVFIDDKIIFLDEDGLFDQDN